MGEIQLVKFKYIEKDFESILLLMEVPTTHHASGSIIKAKKILPLIFLDVVHYLDFG